jgi:hypothetical protein
VISNGHSAEMLNQRYSIWWYVDMSESERWDVLTKKRVGVEGEEGLVMEIGDR